MSFFGNFKKCVIVDDLIRINRYGFSSHMRYLFNFSKTCVYTQIELNRLPVLPIISPFVVRELDSKNLEDLELWANIINLSYQEEQHTKEMLETALINHLYLNIKKIFLVFDEAKCIGTISVGTYKTNSKIGGGIRLAVHPDYRGQGLGKYLSLRTLHYSRENGIRLYEALISIKRGSSIVSKFQLGHFPQFSRKYVQYKNQRRFFIIRLMVNYKLYKMWRKHKTKLYKQFIEENSS